MIKKGVTVGSLFLNFRKVCKSCSFPLLLLKTNAQDKVPGVKGTSHELPLPVQRILGHHVGFISPYVALPPSDYVAGVVLGSMDQVAKQLQLTSIVDDSQRQMEVAHWTQLAENRMRREVVDVVALKQWTADMCFTRNYLE